MTENMSIVPSEHQIRIVRPSILSMPEIEAVQQICRVAARSGFLQSNAAMNNMQQREADAFFVGMYGLELGVPVITALRQIYVIDGKPACSAALLVSLLRRGGCNVELPDPATVTEETGATVYITRPGGERHAYTYTKKMAEDANLWGKKKNWINSWREMLIWRAAATGSRMEGGDLTNGLYTVEELSPDTEVDEAGAPIRVSIPTAEDAHLPATEGEVVDHPAQPKGSTRTAQPQPPQPPAGNPPPESKTGPWAKANWQTFVAACKNKTGGWEEIVPDLVKEKGITNINDPEQWDKAFPTGREAAMFVEAAYAAISNTTPAEPKKGVDDLLPPLDEKGIEELRKHLREDYWMLTEEETLAKLDLKDWSKYTTLDDAKKAVREAMIQTCESVVAYKARYMGQYTEFFTVFGSIRCYGRDQLRTLSAEWGAYAETWKKGKDYLFADAQREPVVIYWSWAGEGDKKYMLVDKDNGLLIYTPDAVPF